MLRRRRLRNRPLLSNNGNSPSLQRHGSGNSESRNGGIVLEELNFGVSVRSLRPNLTYDQGNIIFITISIDIVIR